MNPDAIDRLAAIEHKLDILISLLIDDTDPDDSQPLLDLDGNAAGQPRNEAQSL